MCQQLSKKSKKTPQRNAFIEWPNPYRIKYVEKYIKYSLLLSEQESIGWDNLLCSKFLKQWLNLQHFYKAKQKNDNCMATACSNAKLTPAQRKQKQKKKHKQNVFQQIISSLFKATLDMWKHHNRDCQVAMMYPLSQNLTAKSNSYMARSLW